MRFFLFTLIILSALVSASQAPFATYRLTVNASSKNVVDDSATFVDNVLNELSKPDFFAHANANLVSIQGGRKLFPTVNGEILNYKLRLWTRSDSNNKAKSYVLPFFLISKVSGNYKDSAAGTINDATSYFGAPLTFRISPSFELLTQSNTNNKLFAGFNFDARLITIGNTLNNDIETGWGGYSSFGLTYMGTGYAYQGEDTDKSKRYEGKWSFSAMLYLFKSGGKFNKAVFDNSEAKTLSGVELLLRFKALNTKDSKFNFLFGASNGFTRGASNFATWEFKIGLGN